MDCDSSYAGVHILSWNMRENAQWHADQYIGVSIELGMHYLSNAMHFYQQPAPLPFEYDDLTSVWTRLNKLHLTYMAITVRELLWEWEHRFGHPHRVAGALRGITPLSLCRGTWVNPPLTVPDVFKWGSIPISYRLWYLNGPAGLTWMRRERPWWI